MALARGTHLGPYHIADQIGAGGMGEVYRATDTNLGRQVALKVLPDVFASDAERLARFDREARMLAALNHPNIAAIYGVEKDGGTTALVMELVEGPTLADRITQGAIPVDDALTICRQMAQALGAAHEQGIVHRDLKPANIKLRADGTVKVLDFGLAKAIEPAVAMSPGLSVSPTITTPAMTQAGIVLGTAAYMSPEQAKGRAVDKRTDIWAFGVVLYESIVGRRPFEGDGVPETLAAIIRDEPALESIPPRLRPLVRKCLEKDPAKRLRDIGDAFALIDAAQIDERPAPRLVSVRLWQGLAVLLAIGIGLAIWAPWRHVPDAEVVRFQIPFPEGRTIGNFAVSPDGRKVVMQVRTVDGIRLWLRSLESLDTRELPGTETAGTPPFWSFDSRWIVFNSPDSKLKKIDTNGGPALTICESCGLAVGGSWNADGVILFGGPNGIMKMSASGGSPVPVVANAQPLGPRSFAAFPTFLPDGRRFLYVRGTDSGEAVFRGSLDRVSSDQESVPLVKDAGNSTSGSGAIGFAPGLNGREGHLLFFRGAAVMAQALDEGSGDLRGEAVPLAERASFFWVARDTLLHTSGGSTSRLTWVENGKATEPVGDPDAYSAIALSPDGRRIAAVKRSDTGSDLWLVDVRGARSERLTFTGSISNTRPVWSADGQSIVFSDFGKGNDRIFRKVVNSTAEPTLLFASPNSGYVTSLTSDGRFLLHMIFDRKTRDIGLVPLDAGGDRQSTRLISTPFDETDAHFSPDGRWIAYKSNETGRVGIYAATFVTGSGTQTPRLGPRYPVSKGAEQVSAVGNTGLFWRGDSKAIFYLTPKGLMTSELGTDSGSPFSDPRLVFPLTFEGGVAGDMTLDARRALVAVPASDAAAGITVVLNWQASLPK